MAKQLAVITGASAGLGETFARQLGGRGMNLLLVARRLELLEALAGELREKYAVEVECYRCDLANAEQLEALAALLEAAAPDVLVNNAGFGTKKRYWDADYARQVEMVKVHVLATMRLTRAVLPGMIARNSGAVINVSSVAGFFRSAGNVSYCATKGWMNDFTEGLRLELDSVRSKVTVQALCPGFTYTNFHEVMGVDREMIPKWLWMDADYVVAESLRGMDGGDVFVIPNWKYKFAATLSSHLPAKWRMRLERSSPHKRKVSVEG
jgi:uncharacterized protein